MEFTERLSPKTRERLRREQFERDREEWERDTEARELRNRRRAEAEAEAERVQEMLRERARNPGLPKKVRTVTSPNNRTRKSPPVKKTWADTCTEIGDGIMYCASKTKEGLEYCYEGVCHAFGKTRKSPTPPGRTSPQQQRREENYARRQSENENARRRQEEEEAERQREAARQREAERQKYKPFGQKNNSSFRNRRQYDEDDDDDDDNDEDDERQSNSNRGRSSFNSNSNSNSNNNHGRSSFNSNSNSNSNNNHGRSSFNSNSNSNSNNNHGRSSPNSGKEEAKKPSSPQYYEGQSDWEILGVPRGSTKSIIKKAYVKLLREWHPDKVEDTSNPQKVKEAHKRTQRINQAYEALTKKEGEKSKKRQKTMKNKR